MEEILDISDKGKYHEEEEAKLRAV